MDEDAQLSPEAERVAEAVEQINEPPDVMKEAILRHSREGGNILAGLTENRPVDDEPDPELVELGEQVYRRRKAEQAAQPEPLSEETRELLTEATERELADGDSVEK